MADAAVQNEEWIIEMIADAVAGHKIVSRRQLRPVAEVLEVEIEELESYYLTKLQSGAKLPFLVIEPDFLQEED